MRRHAPFVFLLVLNLFAGVSGSHAETPAAARSVAGTVKDAKGRGLPGVHVRLETQEGHVAASTVSDAAGHFAFPTVAAGTYTVVATKEAFEPANAEAVVSGTEE